MKRKLAIITFIMLAPAAMAIAMSSGSYTLSGSNDCGGRSASSASNQVTRVSIGGAVARMSQSANYVVYTGPKRKKEIPPIITINSVSKTALTTGETCTIDWHADRDGSFIIELGGDGTPGSGTQLASGNCLAAISVLTDILESDLTDNAQNTIHIIVDDGATQSFAAVVLLDDQVGPDVSFTQVTIRGTVDSDSITEVDVDGVPVPVTARQYEAIVNTPASEIYISIKNQYGATTTRIIRLQ